MKQFEKAIASFARATESGNPEEAQQAAVQALMLASEEAVRNPTPNLLLKGEAEECESRRDWTGAEAAYRKLLALEGSSGNQGALAKAQMDLSRLLRRTERLEEAAELSRAAVASARQTIFPVLVMSLETEVACALAKGEPESALAAASEALQIIEPGKVYDGMRARTLISRAKCRLATGDLGGAETDLAASWELLQGPTIPWKLAGPMLAMGNWWEVKSLALQAKGDLREAREAMVRALEYRRRLQGAYVAFAVMESLERVRELAAALGDETAATAAQNEANAIRSSLSLPRLQ